MNRKRCDPDRMDFEEEGNDAKKQKKKNIAENYFCFIRFVPVRAALKLSYDSESRADRKG